MHYYTRCSSPFTLTLMVFVCGAVVQLTLGSVFFSYYRPAWFLVLVGVACGGGSLASIWGILGSRRYPWQFVTLLAATCAYVCMERAFRFSWTFETWLMLFLLQAVVTGLALLVVRALGCTLIRCEPSSVTATLVAGSKTGNDGTHMQRDPTSLQTIPSVALPLFAVVGVLIAIPPHRAILNYVEWPFPKQMAIFASLAVAVVGVMMWTRSRGSRSLALAVVLIATEVLIAIGLRNREECYSWMLVTATVFLWMVAYLALLERFGYGVEWDQGGGT
ncbi:MAG: hypothetical protein ABFC96_12535 [Thermoguttaceae bacterium]